jgi:ankyrin repeat protein
MINTKILRQTIKTGDTAQVTEILRYAPKMDIRFAYEWTPLHIAAKHGNRAVVAAIIEAGADINATSEMHETPLDIALRHDHKAVAEFFRKRGGRSGAQLSLHAAVAAGDLKSVKGHVRTGADINAPGGAPALYRTGIQALGHREIPPEQRM